VGERKRGKYVLNSTEQYEFPNQKKGENSVLNRLTDDNPKMF